MKAAYINNFNNSANVCVTRLDCREPTPLVAVIQHSGGMNFQHTMTPAQARSMAVALTAHADDCEKVQQVHAVECEGVAA